MKDKPNKLDDVIREKMANLGAPYRPETWDWLNERLDAKPVPAADPMDDIVRDKLAGLSAPYRPESWDWMSEQLDALDEGAPAGAEQQTMDEAIYERMHRLEKPYDPNHWPMLLKKLEANAYVGERVIRYKAMELSLLLLLLITFVRLPFQPDATEPVEPLPIRPQAQLEDQKITDEAQTQTNTAATSGTIADESADSFAASMSTFGESTPDTETQPLIDLAAVEGNRNRIGSNPIGDLTRLPSETRRLTVPNPKLHGVTPNQSSSIAAPEPHALLGIQKRPILGMLAYLPSGMSYPICLSCTGKLDHEAQKAKQPTFLRIGIQGGPDYNRVITPSTVIEGQSHEDDRYSLGYSGGLTIGLEKGRWEIETGLIYSNKRYLPLPVFVVDYSIEEGFTGDGTKQFDLDVFQVPLNFRYNFIRKNRWRVYAMAGMSLHVTTQSNYYLDQTDRRTTAGSHPKPSPYPGGGNSGRNAPSIKSEFDNFTKGWLDGGEFSKNSYLTGNVGFGVERFLTDYWSIYAQPTYNHSLIYLNNGLGPYYDRIHTNSLIVGFKVRLK